MTFHLHTTTTLFNSVHELYCLPYPSLLHEVGQHDDSVTLLFPHHSPEIFRSIRQGTLSGYISVLLLVTLHRIDEKNHSVIAINSVFVVKQ